MNDTIYNLTSNYNPYGATTIDISDLLGKMQYNYAFLLFALSAIIFAYVIWNNFVRAPSKKRNIKEFLDSQEQVLALEDVGVASSERVQRISRELDSHMIMFSLALLYISGSYYFSFR